MFGPKKNQSSESVSSGLELTTLEWSESSRESLAAINKDQNRNPANKLEDTGINLSTNLLKKNLRSKFSYISNTANKLEAPVVNSGLSKVPDTTNRINLSITKSPGKMQDDQINIRIRCTRSASLVSSTVVEKEETLKRTRKSASASVGTRTNIGAKRVKFDASHTLSGTSFKEDKTLLIRLCDLSKQKLSENSQCLEEKNESCTKLLPKFVSTPKTNVSCIESGTASNLRTRGSASFIDSSSIGVNASMNEEIQKIIDLEKRRLELQYQQDQRNKKNKSKLRKSTIKKLQTTIQNTIREELMKFVPKKVSKQSHTRHPKTTIIKHKIIRKIVPKRQTSTADKEIQVNISAGVDYAVQTELVDQYVYTRRHLSAIVEKPTVFVQDMNLQTKQTTMGIARRSLRIRAYSQHKD